MEPKKQTEPQKHRPFFERLRGGLESLQDTSQTFERVVIDNLSAFTPWLAPLIPASMAYRNMITRLDFSPLVSLFGAAAVEFLGLTTISTALEFWKFNQDKRKSDNSAPFVVALLTGVFYVVIILTVNAMLELNQSLEVKVAAKAMLSLLSVVAAVIIALRSQHRRRLKEIADEKAQRKAERQQARGSHDSHEAPIESPRISYEEYVKLNESRNGQGPITAKELVETYGIPNATAFRWQANYRKSYEVKVND
jgi:hypothetical protein